MKFMKQILTLTALSAALVMGLAACGKNSNDSSGLNVGSLTSDGNAVTSNTSLSGYALNLAIRDIVRYSNGCYPGQYCNTALAFTVTANNDYRQLQANPQYGYSSGRMQQNIAGYQVLYQAACYDQSCSTVAVEVIFGTGYEYRQIVIKKDFSSNKIVNMGEWTSSGMNLRTLQQAMTEI